MSDDVFTIDVQYDPSGRVCVVALAGKLDPLATEQLEPRLAALYDGGQRLFVCDLERLEYVGSLGLRVIVGLANKLRADGSLVVCNVSDPVRRILDLTKVGQILRVYQTRADAI